MVYKDLIEELQKVITPEDVSDTTLDELINASISSLIGYHLATENAETPSEALQLARLDLLNHMDDILFSMRMDDMMDDNLN